MCPEYSVTEEGLQVAATQETLLAAQLVPAALLYLAWDDDVPRTQQCVRDEVPLYDEASGFSSALQIPRAVELPWQAAEPSGSAGPSASASASASTSTKKPKWFK